MSTVVANPTRQHSHRLAAALDRAGLLRAYLTMIPTPENIESWPRLEADLMKRIAPRLEPVDVAPANIRYWLLPWAIKRGLDRIVPASVAPFTEISAYAGFDLWSAAWIKTLRPDAVVGYEMAAVRGFETAKSLGALCILDAASFESSLQDRLIETQGRQARTWVGRWIRKRKAREIALADIIICCSDIAARSYVERGFPADRVVVNPLGCDVAAFSANARTAGGDPKFCFVGSASETKGFADLLAAFAGCRQRKPDVELHIFGDRPLATALGARDGEDGVRLRGKKGHAELATLLAGMDALVLPSVLDSFGMVVAEALASGTYVIASDHVGAAMMITEPRIGTIFPARNREALTAAMIRTVEDIAVIRRDAAPRRAVAANFDWSQYSSRVLKLFEGFGNRNSPLAKKPLQVA